MPAGSRRGPRRSRRPSPAVAVRARRDRLERVDVAQLVAERPRSRPAGARVTSRSTASRLPPASPRPEVDDRPAAVVGQTVVARPVAALDRRRSPSTTAARAAATSSAWRTWNATDGPLRSTNSHGGAPELGGDARREHLGRVAVDVEAPGRSSTASRSARPPRGSVAVLQPVVAEVLDAADPDARRDVGHDPAGQDRDVQPPGPGGRDAAASRRSARWASGSMWADGRVARPDRQRPVEVGDDEQRRPGRDQARRAPRRSRRPDEARRRAAAPPAPARSRRDVDARQDRLEAAGHDVGPDAAEGAVADDPVLVDPEVDRQGDGVPAQSPREPSPSRPSGKVAPSCSAKAATMPSSSLTSMARTTRPSSA